MNRIIGLQIVLLSIALSIWHLYILLSYWAHQTLFIIIIVNCWIINFHAYLVDILTPCSTKANLIILLILSLFLFTLYIWSDSSIFKIILI